MGMDLSAVAPSRPVGSWHANWFGWAQLGDLLSDLGADVSQMAGSNDGDLVDAVTAQDWADRLGEALAAKRVWLAVSPSAGERFAVVSVPAEVVGRSRPASALAEALCGRAPEGSLVDVVVDGVLVADVEATVAAVGFELVPLRLEDEQWLQSAVEFFRHCGGFRQY